MLNNIVLHNNQKISIIVNKKSFEDVVNSLEKNIQYIKIDKQKTEIKVYEKENTVSFLIQIKIAESEDIKKIIKSIKDKIEFHCLYLIDKKPKNIIINYDGNY